MKKTTAWATSLLLSSLLMACNLPTSNSTNNETENSTENAAENQNENENTNHTNSLTNATQSVTITFDLKNGANSVRCGQSIKVVNSVYDHTTKQAKTPAETQTTDGKLVDTRFYVSNPMLVDAAGNSVPVVLDENANQSKGVALMDFGNAGTDGVCSADNTYKTTITGKVVPGSYTGLKATIGVPVYANDNTTRMNHTDKTDTINTPAPLAVSSMSWSWQAGRKFMKIDFKPDLAITKPDNSTIAIWNTHLGSTGCSGDPIVGDVTTCTNENRLNLNFPSFDTQVNKVVLDISKLYANSDLTFDGGMMAGCMSGPTDPECGGIFKALGIGLSGTNAGKTLSGTESQTVFYVE